MTSYQSIGKGVTPILIALTCIKLTKCIQIEINKVILKSRNPILFGENIRTGCSYQLTRDELTQKCQFYRQRMLQLLLGKLIYYIFIFPVKFLLIEKLFLYDSLNSSFLSSCRWAENRK